MTDLQRKRLEHAKDLAEQAEIIVREFRLRRNEELCDGRGHLADKIDTVCAILREVLE
jgi:hypothetical protein